MVDTAVETTIDTKVNTKISTNIGTFLNILNELASKIFNNTVNIPNYLWNGEEKNIQIITIDNILCLSFILMYLFCVLIFRCTWITHFFVTHRIIMRRLKKLNSDITHRTEFENSINLNSGNMRTGVGTKKSRNIADAREIEKELQDILSDIQLIPIVMCRPKIVIVFDELDKVEPGDTGPEKENLQTKASLFSINATRERQTEILRILSNMKYFLSTANAKFIFITGREMFDIHLADVSERNNYIGSIFNVVILVPSFLTDHQTGKESIPQESSIASLPEEFVCRRLIPYDFPIDSYNLESYRIYLEKEIFREDKNDKEKIHKIIAVLQQFIIYLAHVSKGAPKKMMQIFESFIEIHIEYDENKKNTLFVQRYHSSRHFLSFNYYKQYTLGIIAYLITPVFYRLAESNIKEHSDKLLVSSLRFVDFLFKFHKHSFSWKHLDMSPEMLEVNRAPELKSVAVDLLNYLTQIHINKFNFSLSDYKFDGLIANEIFAMAKTDEVFSALFNFSLDEMLPLKKHYKDLLENTKKEYENKKESSEFIDAISSLQGVLGDLHYYDDELEEAETFYKSVVHTLRNDERKRETTIDQLYVYVRNMLRLGVIYEKRKQYDFAYLTYGEICKRIIQERDIAFNKLDVGIELRKDKDDKIVFVKASSTVCICPEERKYNNNIEIPYETIEIPVKPLIASLQPLNFKNISPSTNNLLFKKMTFEGLKMLYLPFIAKLQILEKSHVGGITQDHLKQLDKEFELLTFIINHEEAKLLEAEFYSRVADILYYKNSDMKCKKDINRKSDKDENNNKDNKKNPPGNCSCSVCYYYHKALSVLLNKPDFDKPEKKDDNTVIKLLIASVEQLYDENRQINSNYNLKFCTTLARILSDWGNVFFSCDSKNKNDECGCYICDTIDINTRQICYYCACYICDIYDYEKNNLETILKKYINYMDSESKDDNREVLLRHFNNIINSNMIFTKMEIALAMYSISSVAYRKSNLDKCSAYQIYKMLCLFKDYEINKCEKSENYIKRLSEQSINYLWYANDDLNLLELNKRKKDFGKTTIRNKDKMPLQYLLVDSEITRIRILVKELELKLTKTPEKLMKFYDLCITSPYKINYSIVGRIYRLRLKTKLNYKTYKMILNKDLSKDSIAKKKTTINELKSEINTILEDPNCILTAKEIFRENFTIIQIFENLIAESIYCLMDAAQLLETMDETYLFPHSYIGSIHDHLSFWIRIYEVYEIYMEENPEIQRDSQIKNYLTQYLDEEWREQLSGYRENQRALSHYNKCMEMHNEGRAYHNMIDNMCYVKDDFNERSDHFNIAEERHLIVNGKIENKIKTLKDIYKDSKLYKVENYYEIADKERENEE